MSGVDRMWRAGCSAAFAAALLVPSAGHAQSSFGGSFDSAPGGAAPAPAPTYPPPAQDDGFGGSFGGGGGPSSPPAAQPAPGGSGFGSGSFDSEVVEAQPRPEPPEATPPSRPEQPPQARIAVDPQILAFESRDFGVPATDRLRSGAMHAPTPVNAPGAGTVSTQGLVEALESGLELVLIDVLGSTYSLPGAVMAPALASSGHYNDRIQQQARNWLGQITQGMSDMPIVIYCSDPQCWLSYNATLRTVAAGYTNVYWYRGGLQAWQMAGLQLAPTGF